MEEGEELSIERSSYEREELLLQGNISHKRTVIAGEESLSQRKKYHYREGNYNGRRTQITRLEIHESQCDSPKDRL